MFHSIAKCWAIALMNHLESWLSEIMYGIFVSGWRAFSSVSLCKCMESVVREK
jgi:hypothetical protein